MKSSFNYYSRKIHRYLGIFIGIQFLLWTIGGLYFSWTNIKEIRGEHLKKEKTDIAFSENFLSPNVAITKIKQANEVTKLRSIQLVEVLEKPFYEIIFSDKANKKRIFLADAITGEIQTDFSKEEAIKIATKALVKKSKVKEVIILDEKSVGKHHEYREKPLPAFAITFEKPSDLTVYVSAKTGKVESFRTNQWRIFDFLWMLHTMDYQGRDNFNNYLLRAFSILGIATILSGFLLFFLTSPVLRRKKPKNLNQST